MKFISAYLSYTRRVSLGSLRTNSLKIRPLRLERNVNYRRDMKKLIFTFVCLSQLAFVTGAHAFNVKIKGMDIEIGKKRSEPVAAPPAAPVERKTMHTCSVEAFGQKFFGEADSEPRAKRKAIEACQEEYHGMHCERARCSS